MGPRLSLVPASRQAVRLNPLRQIARDARELRLTRGELLRYLPEPRGVVIARVALPDGRELVAGSTHCHNSRDSELVGREIARAAGALLAAAGDRPAVLAGDLNVPPTHGALSALHGGGWGSAGEARDVGIDRILHRGFEVVEAPRRLPPEEREVVVSWGGASRRVRLSDHDPVTAVLRASASPAGPPEAR